MGNKKTCSKCIWYDQCGDSTICSDYTTPDDPGVDFTYYKKILDENHQEYLRLAAEMEE